MSYINKRKFLGSNYDGIYKPIIAGYDPDAQAFIDASGITNTTQQDAINQLVLDLKSYNIWNKMKAIYPIVGGTASTHKWNLKDPRDLDAAFRLTFATGYTHSSTGMTPNGTSAFSNTFLNTQTNLTLNSGSYGFYSRTQNGTQSCDMGNYKSTPDSYTYLYTYVTGGFRDYRYCEGVGLTRKSGIVRTDGFFAVSRTAANATKGYRNGIVEISATTASNSTSLINFYISAYNNNGTATAYSTRQIAFAYISDGLNDTESSNLYTAVQNYQTTLGRNV